MSQRPGAQRPAQQRHRVALGLDRAAEAAAEPAVVAGRAPVVGHRVHAGRAAVRVQAGPLGRGHRQDGALHVGARRHRERSRPPRRERVRLLAGHPDEPLGLGVVRLEVVVGERPVDDVGALDRAERRAAAGSRPPGSGAACRRRGSRRRRPSTAASSRGRRRGGRRRPRPRRNVRGSTSGSGPSRWRCSDLSSSLAEWPSGPNGASSSIRWFAPFSSTTTVQPCAVSRSATVEPDGPEPTMTASQSSPSTGPVARAHRPSTSASVQPRGCTSPANPMAAHPAPSRLPP